MKCIYCGQPTTAEPPEHIIPEGLIGDRAVILIAASRDERRIEHMVLRNGEVCKRCNTQRLAPLDQRLQEEFGIFKALLNPLGTKSGKPVRVTVPGAHITNDPGERAVWVNDTDQPFVTRDGILIPPVGDQKNAAILSEMILEGPRPRVSVQQRMPYSKRAIRALHKIAFETLCLVEGVDTVLTEDLDAVRTYVLTGKGSRTLGIAREAPFQLEVNKTERAPDGTVMQSTSTPLSSWDPLVVHWWNPLDSSWMVYLQLGLSFIIDLSPDNRCMTGTRVRELSENIILMSDKPAQRTG